MILCTVIKTELKEDIIKSSLQVSLDLEVSFSYRWKLKLSS